MADRPILFSAGLVQALLAGVKTQTRRLATSPLARVQAGDRLYVRETYRFPAYADILKPAHVPENELTHYEANGEADGRLFGKTRVSIHMPRWASRLTLTVTETRLQPLQAISWDDARAEGIVGAPFMGWAALHAYERDAEHRPLRPLIEGLTERTPPSAYARLWDSLHTVPGQTWRDNPAVVALTFTVERRNIDEDVAGG